ncbi:MAG: transketolase C-terminal domain-containing protein [Clostridia bacterium]
MRDTFVNCLVEYASTHDNLILLTGDLGYGALEPFIERFPNRFFNCGIAEQNMMGVASGLALEGKKVVIYSIGNFDTLRCLEQIRNNISYHNLDVKIVSIGSGMEYGSLGYSHHATEDISAIRGLPNINIYCPSCKSECKAVCMQMLKETSPCVLRLNKRGADDVLPKEIHLNKATVNKVFDGEKIALLCTGSILSEGIMCHDILAKNGHNIAVYAFPTIEPVQKNKILEIAKKYDTIVTLEEHNVMGGFGSSIAEVTAENYPCPVIRIGLRDVFSSKIGSQKYLREVYHMDAASVAKEISKLY